MLQSIDRLFGILTPHICFACGREGSLLCTSCLETAGEPIPPRCVGCHQLSPDFTTCKSCRSWMQVKAVYAATLYEGFYERLIKALKFDAQRQAIEPIAHIMADMMGGFGSDILLCPLPTAPARIRERGFDHTKLLATRLAALSNREYQSLLLRRTNVRQLGSSRAKRLEQMEQEFYIRSNQSIIGRKILLIDDVVTTGASLSAAAKVLKKAGAKQVQALVFAQKV
jgi:ComF family protein